ncbi:MAG: transcriptional regulator [Pseudomonadota bacterium]
MKKTQSQMAQLLGTSVKAIHSYEQGWRSIPTHAERQLLFLAFMSGQGKLAPKHCWTIKKCPAGQRSKCPAWEFHVGHLCWFINGTICEGTVQKGWREKMKMCRSCEVFRSLF